MAYQILFSDEATKDIKKLDPVIRKRLGKKFIALSHDTDIKQISKKLVNSNAGQYRLRVGHYRVIFDLKGKTVFVLRVRHRKEVYRDKR